MPTKVEYLKKLQALYQERTGIELSGELAEDYFELLIGLVQATYQPIIAHYGGSTPDGE